MNSLRTAKSALLPVFPWDTLADVTATARAHPDGIVDLSVGTPVDEVAPVIRREMDAARPAPDEDSVARASVAVAKAKVLTTEVALQVTEKLFELAGSRATLAEFNLDRHWRNARVHTLHDPVRWKYQHIGRWVLRGESPPIHGVI